MTILSNIWAGGIASARRINEVLDTVPDVRDAPGCASPCPNRRRGGWSSRTSPSTTTARHAESVLEGIDLTIEPGQTVAFLGSTGSGKSTLVNLVPRFYDVSAGRILLDGIDIRRLRQDSLLAQIGIVPQETVLFSGTVRDNIRYGVPGAGDEEIVAAAKAAQAHDFILALPQGYDTHVEERGVNLSGGQKQRIAIARALLTAAEDPDPRRQHQLRGCGDRDEDPGGAGDPDATGTRRFVVAQRISTVLKADKIVVLENGRIAAEGSHAELIAACPIYREIFESQLGSGCTRKRSAA
ncbi:MAG: ABC transporter ATP-binding protein/permease [Candidatus Moduliflexus flocculans]|nr:ABC transporter ATP-binding protein/permease [Candidatus Moduliflexus flocculans]